MPRALVTGAFSNTGSAVAAQLISRGWEVDTLTNRVAPSSSPIRAFPLRFDREHLRRVMDGVDLFVNTYWIRFPYRDMHFNDAVVNTLTLFDAACDAGVGRIVQVSVSNASRDSGLSYYAGKAQIDRALVATKMSHAIVRPTLIVGPHDVLTNNIAWFIRRFPVFAIPSGSGYQLQPVTLDDAGRIIADAAESTQDLDIDVAGPEVFTFGEYVHILARAVGKRLRAVSLPPSAVVGALRCCNPFLKDTVLTFEELEGLRRNMLISHAPPLGDESVQAWLMQHGSAFGRQYTNDTLTRFSTSRR